MQYIKSSIDTKKLISQANETMLSINNGELKQQNIILLLNDNGRTHSEELKNFTNKDVKQVLENNPNSASFVITDIASMDTNGQELTYYLYKGYSKVAEKGFVFFQPINKDTLEPIGKMQFSNFEEDIFYNTSSPDGEESSCNAIETKNNTPEKPEIAFLIGHMDETRLIYDIERLIIDTANNVSKHQKLVFNFIIRASVFGNKPSNEFASKIEKIENFIKEIVEPEFPNSKFTFELEI